MLSVLFHFSKIKVCDIKHFIKFVASPTRKRQIGDQGPRDKISLNELKVLGPRNTDRLVLYSLAFSILQIEVRVEVDEDPLVRTRRRYHPHAPLRRRIRHGVSGRGEVVGGWDSDVASTFICSREWKEFLKDRNKRDSAGHDLPVLVEQNTPVLLLVLLLILIYSNKTEYYSWSYEVDSSLLFSDRYNKKRFSLGRCTINYPNKTVGIFQTVSNWSQKSESYILFL